jgi:hypothetical protein
MNAGYGASSLKNGYFGLNFFRPHNDDKLHIISLLKGTLVSRFTRRSVSGKPSGWLSLIVPEVTVTAVKEKTTFFDIFIDRIFSPSLLIYKSLRQNKSAG